MEMMNPVVFVVVLLYAKWVAMAHTINAWHAVKIGALKAKPSTSLSRQHRRFAGNLSILGGRCLSRGTCVVPLFRKSIQHMADEHHINVNRSRTLPNIMSTSTACCFNELTDSIAQINAEWKKRWDMQDPGFCFRGADSATYDLNPSILRPPYPDSAERLAKIENTLWVEFRLRSKPLLGHHVSSGWEALLIMQQYGFPTRFLDWSRSLAVAAYFAVRNLDKNEDGAVWIIAARRLMELRGISDAWRTAIGDPTIEKMSLRKDINNLDEFVDQNPIAISPDQIVPRMIAQRGIYTLHTFQKYAIESLAEEDFKTYGDACFLHKIIIPARAKKNIRSELLVVAGISEETIFPDIEGFARDFVSQYYKYSD